MKFDNKVVVVTGAGGGIGRQLVLQLLKIGSSVAAIDINKVALEETKKAATFYAVNMSVHVADITDKNSVANALSEIIKKYNHIDVLINNT